MLWAGSSAFSKQSQEDERGGCLRGMLSGSISQMWARRRNERPFSRDRGLSSKVKNAFHSILTFP